MPKAAIHPQRTAFQNSSCDKPKNCGHSNIGQLTRFDGSLEGLKVKIKVNKKPRKFCRVDEDKRKPTVINKFLFYSSTRFRRCMSWILIKEKKNNERDTTTCQLFCGFKKKNLNYYFFFFFYQCHTLMEITNEIDSEK